MNWFVRHVNWTAGIFGHLLIFFLVFIYISPWHEYAWGRQFSQSIVGSMANFRTAEYGFYFNIFTFIYFFIVLILYLEINFWYLYVKRQSYKNLLWLLLPFLPLLIYFVVNITGLNGKVDLPNILDKIISFSIFIVYVLEPVWFGLVAFMLLRLKNNRLPVKDSTWRSMFCTYQKKMTVIN